MYDWATPLLSKGFDGFVYFDLGGVVFEIAEKACGFEKSKITLIDDNQDNIDVATKFGWNGILFRTS